MMMFFLFRAFLVERLNRAVLYAMELRRVRTNAERIEEVMADEPGGGRCERQERPFVVAEGAGVRIEVKDVWFRYGNDSPWILQRREPRPSSRARRSRSPGRREAARRRCST